MSYVIYVQMQPVNDNWTDTIIPRMASGGELDDGLIPAGDECTFFGCYQLCRFNGPSTNCHSTREYFFEANFTSCKYFIAEIPKTLSITKHEHII